MSEAPSADPKGGREGVWRDRRVWLVFGLALAARLALFGWIVGNGYLPDRSEDHAWYAEMGNNLLAGRGFVFQGEPETVRMPGYPLFLAACYGVSGGWRYAPLLAQCLLSAVTAALVLPLAERLGLARWGLAAGIVYALHPAPILYSNILLSDVPFALLLMGALLWLPGQADGGRPLWQARGCAGLMVGLAAWVKPAAGLVLAGLVVAMLIADRLRQAPFRHSVASIAACCGVAVALILPWSVRNRVLFGTFQLTSQAGRDLLQFHASRVEATARHVPRAQVKAEHARLVDAQGPFETPFERSAVQGRLAMQVFRRYPVQTVLGALPGPRNVFLMPSRGNWAIATAGVWLESAGVMEEGLGLHSLRQVSRLPGAAPALFELAVGLVVAIAALAGVVRMARDTGMRWLVAYVVAAPLVYGLLMRGWYGTRYGLPLLPLFCLAAVCGAVALRRQQDGGAEPGG